MAAKPADKDRCEAWTHLRLFVERRPSYPDEAVLMHSDNEDMIRMKHLRAIVRPEIQPREGDTPRTDAQPKAQYRDAVFQELVAADFARQLERELASKTRDADHFFQLSGRYLEELNAVQSATQPCEGSKAYQVAHMEGKPLYVPVCGGHAEGWFTSRDHLRGGMDAECVVCAFVSTIQPRHWVFDAAEKHRPIVEGLVGCEFDRKHLLYMLDRIACRSFSATKACRWLGWIQGVLNEKNALTLDEAKAINKAASVALSATGASIPYRATIKFDHETREVRGTLDLPVDTTVHKEKP